MRGPETARAVTALAIAAVMLFSAGVAAEVAPASSLARAPAPPVVAAVAHPAGLVLAWKNLSLSDANQPPPRNDGNMVYDATDQYVLLFGGTYLNETLGHYVEYNDTWTFADGVWTNVTPTVSPSARQGAGMAYDPAQNDVILFGGRNAEEQDLNDTWVWSSGTWTNLTSSITGPSPPPGFWYSMAYDAQTEAILLFGGINVSNGVTTEYTNATWSFLGDHWTELSPSVEPPARHAQEMIWDDADDEMVMFGGLSSGPYLNDTWTFYDGEWTEVEDAVHPGARAGLGIAYDSSINRVVLYGGEPAPDDFYSTWLYEAGIWTQYNTTIYPPNPQATYGQLTYDARDNEVVDLNEPIAEGPVSTWVLNISNAPIGAVNYPVEFHETGLPAGTSWTVDLAGSDNSSTGATVGFSEPNGTYSFSVEAVNGYTASPSSGSIGVSGGTATEDISFTPGSGALAVTLAATPSTVAVGVETNLSAVTSGGTPPIRYAYTGLPTGCSSQNLPTLPCTPTAAGSYRVTVTATDDLDHVAEANATLTVTTTTVPPSQSPSGSSTWLWIVVALVVVLAVIALVLVLRRRRPPSPVPGAPTYPGGRPTPPPPPPPPGS